MHCSLQSYLARLDQIPGGAASQPVCPPPPWDASVDWLIQPLAGESRGFPGVPDESLITGG